MESKIRKTMSLMRKSYNQPIIFYKLHMNLVFLLKKDSSPHLMNDDWSKMLILSASPNKSPNQGLELKLQKLVRKIRPPLDDSAKMKVVAICFYLMNRPLKLLNHIILFDLVTNFTGHSDFIDALIIKILKRLCTCELYGVEKNLKLLPEALTKMLDIINSCDLTLSNQIHAMPLFISHKNPPTLPSVPPSASFQYFKYLESTLFHIKFCKFPENIERMSSELSLIEKDIERMLGCQYKMGLEVESIDAKSLLLENKEIFRSIKEAFNESNNKKKFIEEIYQLIEELQQRNKF